MIDKQANELKAFRERIIPAVIEEVTETQGWAAVRRETVKKKLGLAHEPVWEARIPIVKTAVRTMAVEGSDKEAALERLKATDAKTHAAYAMGETYEAGEPELVDVLSEVQPDKDADTDDPAVYKKLVRRVAIEEAEAVGWCDSGLNGYLQKLGLAQKVPFYARVAVQVEQKFSVMVPEAESREDAREILANDPERVKELIKQQVSSTMQYRSVEVPELPDPGSQPVVGEIDSQYWRFGAQGGSTSRCNETGRYSDYACTRIRDHEGYHAKHRQHEGTVVATWIDRNSNYAIRTGETADMV